MQEAGEAGVVCRWREAGEEASAWPFPRPVLLRPAARDPLPTSCSRHPPTFARPCVLSLPSSNPFHSSSKPLSVTCRVLVLLWALGRGSSWDAEATPHPALSTCSAKNTYLPPFPASPDANFTKLLVAFQPRHSLALSYTLSSLVTIISPSVWPQQDRNRVVSAAWGWGECRVGG